MPLRMYATSPVGSTIAVESASPTTPTTALAPTVRAVTTPLTGPAWELVTLGLTPNRSGTPTADPNRLGSGPGIGLESGDSTDPKPRPDLISTVNLQWSDTRPSTDTPSWLAWRRKSPRFWAGSPAPVGRFLPDPQQWDRAERGPANILTQRRVGDGAHWTGYPRWVPHRRGVGMRTSATGHAVTSPTTGGHTGHLSWDLPASRPGDVATDRTRAIEV